MDSLDEIFDAEFDDIPKEKLPAVIPGEEAKDVPRDSNGAPEPTGEPLEDDFATARSLMRKVAESASKNASEAAEIAGEMQHPNAWRSAAEFVRAATDSVRAMLDIHLTKKTTEVASLRTEQPQVTNNIDKAIMIGTTEDLLKAVRSGKAQEIIKSK